MRHRSAADCFSGRLTACLLLSAAALSADFVTVRQPRWPVAYPERFEGTVISVDSNQLCFGRLHDTTLTFRLQVVEKLEIGDRTRYDLFRGYFTGPGRDTVVSYRPDKYAGVAWRPVRPRPPNRAEVVTAEEALSLVAFAGATYVGLMYAPLLLVAPLSGAAVTCAIGSKYDPGGRGGWTVLGAYAGYLVGASAGVAYVSAKKLDVEDELAPLVLSVLVCTPAGAVIGYNISNRTPRAKGLGFELGPPTIALSPGHVKRGGLPTPASIGLNLLTVRF